MARDRFGVSERRACRVVGQHRSTQRLEPPPISDEEAQLREWLRDFSKRRRHTPEQIIRKLDEGHRQLAAGKDLDEVCRHLEIAESTWQRWLNQYGGMKANDAKRLRELEGENARLKKLLAEAELDKAILKEIAEGNF